MTVQRVGGLSTPVVVGPAFVGVGVALVVRTSSKVQSVSFGALLAKRGTLPVSDLWSAPFCLHGSTTICFEVRLASRRRCPWQE